LDGDRHAIDQVENRTSICFTDFLRWWASGSVGVVPIPVALAQRLMRDTGVVARGTAK